MGQADHDDFANILDEMGGDGPAVERSSVALDSGAAPTSKPVSEMTLVEQLQAQAHKLKPVGASASEGASSAPKPQAEKRLEDMTLEEQLQYSAARLKSNSAAKAEKA